ncbi:MAG: PEP/pyruvate-binding domain-containing protein [Syntrophobacteraceae bacterium]
MGFANGLKKLFSFRLTSQPVLPFTVLFKKFRSILERNNLILELMADMGDKLGGEYIFDIQYIKDITGRMSDLVFKLISDLCVMTQKDILELFVAFERIQFEIEEELAGRRAASMKRSMEREERRGKKKLARFLSPWFGLADWGHSQPFVILLEDLNGDCEEQAGNKFANLGEIRNTLGLSTMDGFVVTTNAFFDFMEANGLFEIVERTLGGVDQADEAALEALSAEMRKRILSGTMPAEVVSAIHWALDIICKRNAGRGCFFAVRSSGWGEDTEFSFAGQYESVLNVSRKNIVEAWREVAASVYTVEALRYRLHRGYRESETAMAVGCQLMVEAEVSGAMYTYAPIASEQEAMVISAAWGLGVAVASGIAESDTIFVDRISPHKVLSIEPGRKTTKMIGKQGGGTAWVDVPAELQEKVCLSDDYIERLARTAVTIEKYYRRPQDVEWAFDREANLYILQSRPLNVRPEHPERYMVAIDNTALSSKVIFSGKGTVVQGGVGSGKVYVTTSDEDLKDFPFGAVLVARYTSPKYSRIMRRARAILTDIGSATGHMATLAREYRVPTVVDTGIATRVLKTGDEVTLDAIRNVVYAGTVKELNNFEITHEEVFEESCEYRLLKRVLKKVTPLNLVDPASEFFRAARCRTYHDITRFVHEKAVESLIELSEGYHLRHAGRARRLEFSIPLGLTVIDIGKGTSTAPESESLRLEQVESTPLRALLEGLMESGMWETAPVAVDLGSFMSSLTRTFSASMARPEEVGRNLAVLSDNYMNLHLRLGYHFNILDAYIGEELNDNYIYFRFLGGVSNIERRSRRARLIACVMESFDFRVEVHGDLIVGRLKKLSRQRMVGRMKVIGGLIGYTRQLDVNMTGDEMIDFYLADFLQRIQILEEVREDAPLCELPAADPDFNSG